MPPKLIVIVRRTPQGEFQEVLMYPWLLPTHTAAHSCCRLPTLLDLYASHPFQDALPTS
jgi:hypothetical protein